MQIWIVWFSILIHPSPLAPRTASTVMWLTSRGILHISVLESGVKLFSTAASMRGFLSGCCWPTQTACPCPYNTYRTWTESSQYMEITILMLFWNEWIQWKSKSHFHPFCTARRTHGPLSASCVHADGEYSPWLKQIFVMRREGHIWAHSYGGP